MSLNRLWLLIIGLIAGVLAIRPAGEFLIRTEFQRRTGSRLSMERCQFNLLTGGIALENSVIEASESRFQDQSGGQSPIRIDKIWSQGSLAKLLYRKIAVPITVMDGVVISISKIDEAQVPNVHPITELLPAKALLIAPQKNPFFDELNQAFQHTKEAISNHRSAYDQIEQQLAEIEGPSSRHENPLRDQDTYLAAQRRLGNLQSQLVQVRQSLEEDCESFRQTSIAMPRVLPKDHTAFSPKDSIDQTDDLSAIEVQARRLAEQWVCSVVDRMKPYLGLTANLTHRYLLDKELCSSRTPRSSEPFQTPSNRGIDYGFGPLNSGDMLFGSIRMRGAAKVDELKLPFTGQMKNVGSSSLRTEDRPSLKLTFEPPNENENLVDASIWVAAKSTVIPDRQGFKIQSQMIPSGALVASVDQGDWTLAAYGQNSTVNLVWTIHQSEWSLSIEIRSSQSEVVVKRKALPTGIEPPESRPRYESCFAENGTASLARAQFQGHLSDGVPLQSSLSFESPFLRGLADSMFEQQKTLLEIAGNAERKKAEQAYLLSLSGYQNTIDETHHELVKAHENLRLRLEGYEAKLGESAPSREDLRFTRENSGAALR